MSFAWLRLRGASVEEQGSFLTELLTFNNDDILSNDWGPILNASVEELESAPGHCPQGGGGLGGKKRKAQYTKHSRKQENSTPGPVVPLAMFSHVLRTFIMISRILPCSKLLLCIVWPCSCCRVSRNLLNYGAGICSDSSRLDIYGTNSQILGQVYLT